MLTHLNYKAMQLGVVERFITQLELNLLRIPELTNCYAPVKEALADLRDLSVGEQDIETAKRIEHHLEQALAKWQHHLAERDQEIEAYHIRRYCDGFRVPVKQSVYISLLRFYRDIPRSRQAQSKFDLVLTRCFSTQINDLFRAMTMSREEIVESLTGLYRKWDQVEPPRLALSDDVAGFDNFIAENDTLLDFPSLTSSKLFDRIREYKTSLSSKFWEPEVAAAAIECNIVVGNHLNGLMARENENLGERFGSEFDFAGTLQDTSPNASERVTEVLREMDKQDPLISRDFAAHDLSLIRSVIDMSSSGESLDQIPELFIESVEFLDTMRELSDGNSSLRTCCEQIGFRIDVTDSIADLVPTFLGMVELEGIRLILTMASLRAKDLNEPKLLSAKTDLIREIFSRAEILGAELSSEAFEAENGMQRLTLSNAMMGELLKTERAFYLAMANDRSVKPEVRPRSSELTN